LEFIHEPLVKALKINRSSDNLTSSQDKYDSSVTTTTTTNYNSSVTTIYIYICSNVVEVSEGMKINSYSANGSVTRQ